MGGSVPPVAAGAVRGKRRRKRKKERFLRMKDIAPLRRFAPCGASLATSPRPRRAGRGDGTRGQAARPAAALSGTNVIARSARAVIVSDGLTPGFAEIAE